MENIFEKQLMYSKISITFLNGVGQNSMGHLLRPFLSVKHFIEQLQNVFFWVILKDFFDQSALLENPTR